MGSCRCTGPFRDLEDVRWTSRMEEEAGERAIVFSVGWSVILSIEACEAKMGHGRTEFFVGSGRVVCKSLV